MREVNQNGSGPIDAWLCDANADLHLRKLRYFLAVARHLSFAQAGRELFIAQPALSRAVKALEAELGVQLLERDSQRVELTHAGSVLVEEGTALLTRASAARRRVQAAAHQHLLLTVGFQPGVDISELVRAFAALHPEVGLGTKRVDCSADPSRALDGTVDVAVVRAADWSPGPTIFHLAEDPSLVALPANHPLAGHETLTMAGLETETMLRQASSADDARGSAVRNMEEGLEAVLLGEGLAWAPTSAAMYYQRPDIVYRPVKDAPRFDIVLVAEPARIDRNEVQWFVRVARERFGRRAENLPLAIR